MVYLFTSISPFSPKPFGSLVSTKSFKKLKKIEKNYLHNGVDSGTVFVVIKIVR